MRTALVAALTIVAVAGSLTWALDRGSSSGCSPGDTFAAACRASAAEGWTSTGTAATSDSCNPPCLTQSGQIVATGGGGDPWWLWSLWILIATGMMSWGFRREAARLIARLRDGPAADTVEAQRREWAARALARARAKRHRPR